MKYIVKTLLLLVFCLSPLFSYADVVDEVPKQIKANAQKVKSSADKLFSDIESLGKDAETYAENAKNTAKDAAQGAKQVGEMAKEYANLVKSLNFSDIKANDTKAIQEKFKKIKDESLAFKNVPDELKSKLEVIEKDITKIIEDVKNILNVTFTAPVRLTGGYGKAGLTISIDSLRYTRESAEKGTVAMDVMADFQFPFSVSGNSEVTKIGFVGENVVLAGEGDTKIHLKMEQAGQQYRKFKLMEGKAYIAIDSASYVGFNCNGFAGMRLKGYFEFSSKTVFPADTTKEKTLKATFDAEIKNLEDMLFVASLDRPFKVRGTGDIIYEVNDIVADFSTTRNAENFTFPQGYKSPFAAEDANYWTGFAIKAITVDASQEIDCLEKLKISAYNMLIDETGFSGWFSAAFEYDGKNKRSTAKDRVDTVITNASTTSTDEKADKVMKAAIEKIAIGIASNKVVGGELEGSITISGLKDKDDKSSEFSAKLKGQVYTDAKGQFNYDFQATMNKDKTFHLPFCEKADLTIGAGTYIGYMKKLKPDSTYQKGFYCNLNGQIDFKASFVTLEGLKFQNMQFSTYPNYFGGGTYSLDCAKTASLGGLNFGLNKITAGMNTESMMATMGADIKLGIISDGTGASVEAGFTLRSNANKKWKIEEIEINKIAVDIDYSAFHMKGSIERFKDDAVYGKGFAGGIALGIEALNIEAEVAAKFGRAPESSAGKGDGFKYWFVAGNVNVPPGTIIFPPAVMLKNVALAVYSRMKIDGLENGNLKLTEQKTYRPDNSISFGFKGGIGVYVAQDKLVNAQVLLGMEFSKSAGIKNINLNGDVYLLAEKKEKSFIDGHIFAMYDFENKIFHTNAKVKAALKDIITGTGEIDLLTTPDKWHFNFGVYDKPVRLKFMSKIDATAYFMLGHDVPAFLPPLDKDICEKFDITQSGATATDNSGAFKTGQGFAFGAKLSVDLGPKKFIYANVTLKGGTDALVVKGIKSNCTDSERDYRGKGQTYLYLDLGAGVMPRKKRYCIVEMSAFAMLEAEFPDPYYIAGRCDFRYKVLCGLIQGTANAKFSVGKHCDVNGNIIEDEEIDLSDYEGDSFEDALKEAAEKEAEDAENEVND